MIDTSAQNALKNSIYNFIGFLLPIFILIFFTPIIIENLGVKEYGIFIFLNTILTFLGLLDLGISTATNKHIVEYRSLGDEKRLKTLLYSMNSVYLIQALIYLIVCIVIGLIMQNFFVKPTTTVNYLVLLSIIGTSGFISSIFTNFGNLLIPLQRYDLSLKISSTLILLSNVSMLVLAVMGYKLVPILIAQLFITVLGVFIYYFTSRRLLPILVLKYSWDKTELIKNYKFALPVAFNNIASSSLVHFDKLLIPIFLGGASLTYYGVPGSVATKISSISSTFSSLLFPIAVSLHSVNNTEKLKRVYVRSIRLIAILSSAISLSVIFMADKILFFWLGEDFAERSLYVLIILVLTNFVLALYSPLYNLLIGMGKTRFLTTSSFFMAILNIIMLFTLIPMYGINGAAVAYFISTIFVFWMITYSEKKYFGITENIHGKLLLKLILTGVPFYFIIRLLFYPIINSLFGLIIIGPSCVMLYVILYTTFGFFEPEDRNDIRDSLRILLHRFRLRKNRE